MKLLLLLGLFALIGKKCNAVHQESSIRSNSGCFGDTGPIFIKMSCSAGQVISIEKIWAGVKKTSTGCPSLFDDSYDTSCCSPSANPADDCIFAFDHTNFDFYHTACNGQRTCSPRVLRVFSKDGSCNLTIYHATTTFAYVDYVCVDETELNPICTPTSVTITSDYTYITNDGFPSGMSTSTLPCTCSVQTDGPSANLQVVTIQRRFTGNTNVQCDQSLSLLDSGQNELVTWTCDDNTYVEQTTNVNGGYVSLSLVNNRTVAGGTFWVEVKAIGASANANLTLACPAILVTTTTVSTTTTLTTTSTTTEPTTTSTTTTEASTTTTEITTTTTDSTSPPSTITTTDGTPLHNESIIRSNSGCFGDTGPIFITMGCSAGQVISIEQIWVGVKEKSTGCPSVFDVNKSHDIACCSPSANPADNCIFAFDHTEFDFYHSKCNGQRTCTERVLRVLSAVGSCDQFLFPVTTTFAYVDYKCVAATALHPICTPTSATFTSNFTYITSDAFPSGMSTSAAPCNCSVQTDDPSGTLQVVIIQRIFTGKTNGQCDQSLTLLDSGQNELVTWTCDDNTYVEHTTNINENYVILRLINDRSKAEGSFWVRIKSIGASANAKLTLACPAIIVETTTSSTKTTTTDITSTTTHATSSSTTTTTEASTSKTTTDTSSSSVASTKATTITTDDHITNIPNTTEAIEGSLSRKTILIFGTASIASILLAIVVVVVVCIRRGKCGGGTRANNVM